MNNEVKPNGVTVRVEAHYDDENYDCVILHLFVIYNGWVIYYAEHTYHHHYDMNGASGYYTHTGAYISPKDRGALAYLSDKPLGGTDEEWRKFFEGINKHVFDNIFPAKMNKSDVIIMWTKRVLKETEEGTNEEDNRNFIAKWEYSPEIPFNV